MGIFFFNFYKHAISYLRARITILLVNALSLGANSLINEITNSYRPFSC